MELNFTVACQANFLKKLYHAINSKANVQLQLNGFLRISETLAHPKACLHYPIRSVVGALRLLFGKLFRLQARFPDELRDGDRKKVDC